jgi:hypothetical protein
MKAQFTAGPWRVTPPVDLGHGRTWGINGRAECGFTSPQDCRLADVFSTEANAALIAAAPDLYRACQAALIEFGDDELYHTHREIHATLSAAILKAEGGQNETGS